MSEIQVQRQISTRCLLLETTIAGDDGKKIINVKVELSDNEPGEFKFHLNTLPKDKHLKLLEQLKIHQEMQEQYSNDEQTRKLNDKDQVKCILLKNYKAKRSEEKTWTFMAEKLDEEKAAYLRIANAQSLKGTILRAAKFRL